MNNKLGLTSISILFLLATLTACGGGDDATTGIPPSGTGPTTSGTGPTTSGTGSPAAGTVEFFATFPNPGPFRTDPDPVEGFSNDERWWVEQKAPGRATVVNVGRDGGTALRLHTEPGDTNVAGGGTNERNDVALQYAEGVRGRTQWWAHSILFPDDFADLPQNEGGTWNWGSLMNFHDDAGGPTKGPAQLLFYPTGLHYQIYGGNQGNPSLSEYPVGPITRGVWYDFVIHVRWSPEADGFYRVWLNGKRVFQHTGPTLYYGSGVYLKLANYHTTFGRSTSVIHDRVIRGTTWQAVSLTPLEGVSP
ncbi:MAG: heparin lyase I family protein [Pyrinomonadaceae bacterium]|nr:heparin lyase I family protein [Phycisphaerales bacterium]